MEQIAVPRSAFVRWLIEHNPFYLMSAACMLAGVLALTNSLSWSPIKTSRLLTLIVTLNVYEAALIALGLFLVVKRQLVRDGRMLLILEAFFLVDTTFLNAEIVTAHWTLGVIVNVVLWIFAAVKIGVVTRILYPNFPLEKIAYVILQIGALFAIPCVLRKIDHGSISPANLYAAWWLAALLPAFYELLVRVPARGEEFTPTLHYPQAMPTGAYLSLPYLSLLLHVGILHYVYDVTFYGAMAAPILLGLTLIINHTQPSQILPRKDLLFLRLTLPLAAVLVSLNNPYALRVDIGRPSWLNISSIELASTGAYLTYVYIFFLPYALRLVGAAFVMLLIAVFGPAPKTVAKVITKAVNWLGDGASDLVPKTTNQWGVIGLIASFVFLAVGAFFSLKKSAPPLAVRSEAETS